MACLSRAPIVRWALLALAAALAARTAADGQCPALTAPSSTPILEILEPICATGEGCSDDGGEVDESCYDCSLVPYMIDELITDRAESGEDTSVLRNAQKVLAFMCNPCIQPIFPQLIRMDLPDAPPIPPAAAYESACQSPKCLNEYHVVAAAFNASSRGRTLSDFHRLHAACEAHKLDKLAVARAVTTLLQSVGTGEQLGGMLAAEGAARAAAGRARRGGAGRAARVGLACAALALAAAVLSAVRPRRRPPATAAGAACAPAGGGWRPAVAALE